MWPQFKVEPPALFICIQTMYKKSFLHRCTQLQTVLSYVCVLHEITCECKWVRQEQNQFYCSKLRLSVAQGIKFRQALHWSAFLFTQKVHFVVPKDSFLYFSHVYFRRPF